MNVNTKKKTDWGCIFGLLMVVLMIAAGIWAIIRNFQEKSAAKVFDSMSTQNLTTCGRCLTQVASGYFPIIMSSSVENYTEFIPYSPYVRGKVLVVGTTTGIAIGATMLDLSPEIAATNPDEVNTLVCAGEVEQWNSTTYSDNQPGYTLIREICVYDLTMDNIIFAAELWGSRPPATKTQSGPASGSDPARKSLIDILEWLPR